MSMRGEIVSKEYQNIIVVNDKDGKEYSCYADDFKDFNRENGLSSRQKERCLDTSLVLGDTW